DISSTGPESGADDFVGIGFAGDGVGSIARGCAPPGEPSNCKIKAAPEEVNRTVFANKTRPELFENCVDDDQRSPELNDGVTIIGSMLMIAIKGNRIGHLRRHRPDFDIDS